MSALRPELAAIVDELLRKSEDTHEVTLDALGEALGIRAVSHEEIDRMMTALEDKGRTIASPEGGGGEERLRTVLASVRTLSKELGRRPGVAEIATHAKLSESDVRHALLLASVMQR